MQSSVGNRGKDPVAKGGMMLVRLGFLIALIIGLGILTGASWASAALPWHMLAGVLVLIGIWTATIRLATQKRSGMAPVWAAAVLGIVGAGLGSAAMSGAVSGIVHMVVMLLTIGLAEMGVARANKG
jgi:hypothetical protein